MWVLSLGREDPLMEEMAPQLQYSRQENLMDRGTWPVPAHRVTKSWVRLSV